MILLSTICTGLEIDLEDPLKTKGKERWAYTTSVATGLPLLDLIQRCASCFWLFALW